MKPVLSAIAIALALATALPSAASANRDAEATRILAELEAAKGDRKTRLSLIDELVGLAPAPTETLSKFLERDRKSSLADRRALLKSVGAAVPNEKGSFRVPGRQKKESQAEADRFDWADKLSGKPKSTALGEVLADIAAIRALARSDDPRGAHLVLLFGFSPKGIVYRDEVGRYLRRGQPLSVPGLIRGAHNERKEIRRYATYQLERVDRQAPHKAMRAARTNEPLAVAILEAYAETLHREAIYVVLDTIDNPSDGLRAAARKTWLEFVNRKPKRAAPRRRLSLPGGGYTKTTTALYFDHQELADVAVRKRLEKLTGEVPGETATLKEMTEQMFKILDEQRVNEATATYDEARKALANKDYAAAAAGFDQVLALDPKFAKRSEMAAAFLGYGETLLAEKKYDEAAVAFRKANSVDPDGPNAKTALGRSHVARARVIEAEGGDSAAELAKAREADPGGGGDGPVWMMFLGIGAAVAGLFLLVAGIVIRRR